MLMVLGFSSPVFAQEEAAAGSKTGAAGACRNVTGSLYRFLKPPRLRLLPDFSKRVLEVDNPAESFLAEDFRSYLVHGVHGDFLVCPLPASAGRNRFRVRIEEAKNVRIMPSP